MWWGALASAKSMQSPHGWEYGLTCAFSLYTLLLLDYYTLRLAVKMTMMELMIDRHRWWLPTTHLTLHISCGWIHISTRMIFQFIPFSMYKIANIAVLALIWALAHFSGKVAIVSAQRFIKRVCGCYRYNAFQIVEKLVLFMNPVSNKLFQKQWNPSEVTPATDRGAAKFFLSSRHVKWKHQICLSN